MCTGLCCVKFTIDAYKTLLNEKKFSPRAYTKTYEIADK